ncbi:MAG: alpha/beta fold hydrolase [Planctomycetota bacterium]
MSAASPSAGRPRRALRLGFRLVRAAAIAWILFCVALFFGQRYLIFNPSKGRSAGEVPTESFRSDGLTLLVSTRPRETDTAVLYFGGNADDVSRAVPGLATDLPDAAVYAPHYRGYGGSEGSPSEAGIVADAERLYDIVVGRHRRVILVGRSLGTGVAIRLATRPEVARLVLITPYDGLDTVARSRFPFVPVGLLLRDRFESRDWAPRVSVPTWVVIGGRDVVIPREAGEALFRAFPAGVARRVFLPDAGHNDIFGLAACRRAIRGEG